ncbi:AAA family ATPase [Calidifontibacillus oryziterrae]|uniref:AAA family ATPase n=1 Tax=Calidifontibacillus oryziterrae TaxID=1191699 RepID=UPI0003064DC7|nr:P-loop NTPase [Calidifontibacillus oryziterrae]
MEVNNLQPEINKAKRGEMIAVCSAKGGVGKTLLSVNLAVSLSKKNIQVTLVDGDFQFGDVSIAMDLHTTFSIKDVIEEISHLDQFSLANFLNRHESGVKVLAAPERPEHADLITPAIINKVIDLLLIQNDYVVVDTGVGLQDKSLTIIEKADQIIVVTNLEMTTLKNTKLMLETLDILGMRDKVQVVINRSTMESVIEATDVPDILGEENPIYIPNDFQTASQSLNIGVPFVSNQGKTEIAKAVYKMAEQLSSRREITMFKPKSPSIFTKFLSKAKRTKEGI